MYVRTAVWKRTAVLIYSIERIKIDGNNTDDSSDILFNFRYKDNFSIYYKENKKAYQTNKVKISLMYRKLVQKGD